MGKQFSALRGSKLRTAMLLNGVSPHNGKAQLINCRGLGTCGTCAVEIRCVDGNSLCSCNKQQLYAP
jgi:ferredoxin